MQKHFETSKVAIEKENIREKLRLVVAKAMREAGNREDFTKLLKEKKIGIIFRRNEAGRIYGVTFMDFQNRAVLNGSRLGKEFSANVFNELFNSLQEQKIIHRETGERQPELNQDSALGSVFGLLDMPQSSGSDYEEETFVHEQGYEAKRRKLKVKKKGRNL